MPWSENRIRVILADDHTIVAEAIRLILEDACDVVAVVANGLSLVKEVTRLRPDVVVTDLSMPYMDGLQATREIRRMDRPPGIVIVSMHGEAGLVSDALAAGAGGYVLKEGAGSEVVAAVRAVHAGRQYVTPLLRRGDPPAGHPVTAQVGVRLTPRQREVLELTARGYRMKQIAAALAISRRTVESHKYQMMSALAARSTAELVRHAIRMGLIDLLPQR
jgi:DNA-binding NarL/FixJ family response regulator